MDNEDSIKPARRRLCILERRLRLPRRILLLVRTEPSELPRGLLLPARHRDEIFALPVRLQLPFRERGAGCLQSRHFQRAQCLCVHPGAPGLFLRRKRYERLPSLPARHFQRAARCLVLLELPCRLHGDNAGGNEPSIRLRTLSQRNS